MGSTKKGDDSAMAYVFVYGTLRKHEHNHELLAAPEAWAMQSRVRGRLYDTRCGYPAMVLDASCWTYGELYQVDNAQLSVLDRLEGYLGEEHDNLYNRVLVDVETDSGFETAYAYVFSQTQVRGLAEVELGDWRVSRIMKERTEWLFFAYGSAMDHERYEREGVNNQFQNTIGRGTLDGYSLVFSKESWDGSRADIMEVGGTTEGKVYRVGLGGVAYLFEREGVKTGHYRPAVIDLEVCAEEQRDVLVFLNVNKQAESCPPEWYVREILRGARGLVSEDYLDGIMGRVSKLREGRRDF